MEEVSVVEESPAKTIEGGDCLLMHEVVFKDGSAVVDDVPALEVVLPEVSSSNLLPTYFAQTRMSLMASMDVSGKF